MGEANMKFARGEYHEVIMMCQEIIKLGAKKYNRKDKYNCFFPIRQISGSLTIPGQQDLFSLLDKVPNF
mgnify:FL=1